MLYNNFIFLPDLLCVPAPSLPVVFPYENPCWYWYEGRIHSIFPIPNVILFRHLDLYVILNLSALCEIEQRGAHLYIRNFVQFNLKCIPFKSCIKLVIIMHINLYIHFIYVYFYYVVAFQSCTEIKPWIVMFIVYIFFFSLHVLQLYIFFLFGDVSTYNINFGIRERKIEIGKNFKVIWVNYFCSMFFHVFSCFYIFLTFYVQCLNRTNFNYFQCSNELHKIMIFVLSRHYYLPYFLLIFVYTFRRGG